MPAAAVASLPLSKDPPLRRVAQAVLLAQRQRECRLLSEPLRPLAERFSAPRKLARTNKSSSGQGNVGAAPPHQPAEANTAAALCCVTSLASQRLGNQWY
jgi:hypothetical protein